MYEEVHEDSEERPTLNHVGAVGFESGLITELFDAVVIGGGFYGAAIAVYLAKQRGLQRIALLEQEGRLLGRASYHNQARVHNGYHYPRSFTTAYRSRVNLPRFVQDWPEAVRSDFTKIYAIARHNSKVTAKQFQRFCREIGATLDLAPPSLRSLFEPRLIEEVFVAQEYAFDATQLADWAKHSLAEARVEVLLNTKVNHIDWQASQELLRITTQTPEKPNSQQEFASRYVFNCTYSGLNQFAGDFSGTRHRLKHEITEMGLLQVPSPLAELGITVMDGPFFSLMPFPARGLHTLSHVRYTPHQHWLDEPGIDPYQKLSRYPSETRVDRMLRDVCRYLPAIAESRYAESLFEVKTVLMKNEGDDGRPILFEKSTELPGFYSILGGKIDNIYDVFEKLDTENF